MKERFRASKPLAPAEPKHRRCAYYGFAFLDGRRPNLSYSAARR